MYPDGKVPSQSNKFVWAGAWLVATYKGFSEYDLFEPAFDEYEATILTARAANLLSSIRRLGQIGSDEIEVRRKLARLKRSEALPLLSKLADLGAVQLDWKTPEKKEIQYVAAGKTTRRGVFEAAGKLFYALDPTEQEQASLLALDLTAVTPLPATTLHEQIVMQSGFSRDPVSAAIDHLATIGLLDRTRETEGGEPIISNPYAFRSLGEDTETVLSALNEVSPEKALELLDHVKNNPGVPLPTGTDRDVLRVLVKVGLIDHSGIKVRGATKIREFPTIPHLWGVFDTVGNAELDKDLVDDAKLFLNSIRYGEHYSPSSRGRIFDPVVLVDRLISRGEVGPATAIGSDYPLPLSRGIVSIVESRMKPGRFHMQLRKKDVARSVLEILQQGTILGKSADQNEGLQGTSGGQYQAPETLRVTRKLPSKLQRATEELAFQLRSHRKKR